MTELLGCPFCASPGSLFESSDHSGAWEGGCSGEGCVATDCVWDISEELAVAAWNRRASPPEDVVAAARRMLGPIEPDGSYAVDGYYKDAELVARALLSSPQAEDVNWQGHTPDMDAALTAIDKALAALGTDGYRARLDYTNVWRKNAQEAVNHLRVALNQSIIAAQKETER